MGKNFSGCESAQPHKSERGCTDWNAVHKVKNITNYGNSQGPWKE